MAERTMIWKTAAVLAVRYRRRLRRSSTQARSITLTSSGTHSPRPMPTGSSTPRCPGPVSLPTANRPNSYAPGRTNEFNASRLLDGRRPADRRAAGQPNSASNSSHPAGLQSINAGWYNGKPETMANSTYMVAPVGLDQTAIPNSIPGSVSGNDFNNQFTAAVRKIYDSGHNKPVVFSQGAAIMVWTLMNMKNGKYGLLTSHPLPNVGRVVITGNP